jgi:hypothetical protein
LFASVTQSTPSHLSRPVASGGDRKKNGKVADTRLYFDQVQLLTQLGLMSVTATA